MVNITLLPLWEAIYYHFGTKRAHLFGCFSGRGGGKEESEGVGGGGRKRGGKRGWEGERERGEKEEEEEGDNLDLHVLSNRHGHLRETDRQTD